jgi:hypothetical protein
VRAGGGGGGRLYNIIESEKVEQQTCLGYEEYRRGLAKWP